MVYNIQYMFKPESSMSPGFKDNQEVCVHKGLTEYAQDLGVPIFVLQMWEGSGKDSHVTGYTIIDKETNKIVFIDGRHDVIEYIIEQFAANMNTEETPSDQSKKPHITEDNKKDD